MKSPEPKIHYQLQTKSLKLRPYHRKYVNQYHTWFSQYPDLLHLTGSEPLTLQEQIQNHKSWLEDRTKYTFIVFTKQNQKMIGDVNLFFSQWIQPNQAQINIMIAVPEFRGKGYSKQIMEAIELFSVGLYGRDTIIAKIKKDNIPSIKFFGKINYIFIQDNHHYDQKQYRKTINKTKQEALYLLKKQFKLEQITNTQILFQ